MSLATLTDALACAAGKFPGDPAGTSAPHSVSGAIQQVTTMYKNHNAFAKPRQLQWYLFPHACFACRKVFRKPLSTQTRLCPQCAAELVTLGRKFHTPKSTDVAQWRKVQLLVEHGFFFESVYRATESGGHVAVPYPRTLAEVPAFVAEFQSQAMRPQPVRPNPGASSPR